MNKRISVRPRISQSLAGIDGLMGHLQKQGSTSVVIEKAESKGKGVGITVSMKRLDNLPG